MNEWTRAVSLLPEHYRKALETEKEGEEIRLRVGKRPCVLWAGTERTFSDHRVTVHDLERILEKSTRASMHAVTNALREGYISYQGIRIGVCGTAAGGYDGFEGYRAISSIAIRVPCEQKGLGNTLVSKLCQNGFQNTLVISPPGGGKTTLVRELIRCLSEKGIRISVVDERNELSASDGAHARFDLGPHSDVLIGVSKGSACLMLLRGMNPQIIAMDEISEEKDMEAVRRIIGCGVNLLATAHAASLDELSRRKAYREMLEEHVFSSLITIRAENGVRRYDIQALT